MFIQLPDLEGQPVWLNTDYIVSVHPAEHNAAKSVLVFHDGRSVTVDRDCQKIMVEVTAGDHPQFPFPALPSRARQDKRHHSLSVERGSATHRHHQRPAVLPPASA